MLGASACRPWVGRDDVDEVEVVRGLRAGAPIVANPGDQVTEGAIVIAQP